MIEFVRWAALLACIGSGAMCAWLLYHSSGSLEDAWERRHTPEARQLKYWGAAAIGFGLVAQFL